MNSQNLIFVLIFTCLILVSAGFTQYENAGSIVLVNGAVVSLKSSATQEKLSGFALGVGLEQATSGGNWAGGVSFTYLGADDSSDPNDINVNYQTFPIMLFGKYLIGPEKYKAYLTGEIGLHFSRREISGTNVYNSSRESGSALGLGLGGYAFIDEKLLLNLGYKFMYMNNSYYLDGFVHTLSLGIGFQSL